MARKAKASNLPSTEVLPPTGAVTSSAVIVGGRKFTITKQVTVPLLKQVENQPVTFEVLGRMYTGAKLKNEKDPTRKPPIMIDIRELVSNRQMKFIVSAIMKREFEDSYDGDLDNAKAKHTYVGKKFAVLPGALGSTKDGARRLRDVQIVEIEDNGEVA
jgi:hypothetical protein